jgi:serine/threonine protein kinase
MAEGLTAAENAGLVHGDVKPENIMVDADGRIKVLDFGLARAFVSQTGNPFSLRFGTKAYMAPERLGAQAVLPNPRADIFSFGLILREMLTGHHIRTARSAPGPTKLPKSLDVLIRRCLTANPKGRFASLGDMLLALKNCDKTGRRFRVSIPPTGSATASRMENLQIQVRRALRRMGYRNIADSRLALAELKTILARSRSAAIRRIVAESMWEFILRGIDFGDCEMPMTVRELRQEALAVLFRSLKGNLATCFASSELEHRDLYWMNLLGASLSDVGFGTCFLAGADFLRCNLSRAAFAGASIRNANFTDANVSADDFTDADWFNALGWKDRWSVRLGTRMESPASVAAMHQYLKARDLFLFASWPRRQQDELLGVCREYLGRVGPAFHRRLKKKKD